DVAESDTRKREQALAYAGDRFELLDALRDGEVEGVRDRHAAVKNLERLAVVASAAARLAGDEDVREEVHLDAEDAVALTGFAAAAFDVERKAAGFVAARARFGEARVEIAEEREDAGVRRRIRSRGAADRGLIDRDDLVDVREAVDAVAFADGGARAVE